MNLLIELLQIALGHREKMNHAPTETEWNEVYQSASIQSVTGVCFTAIQKLPTEQRSPETLYWEWLGSVTQIQHQNELMDKRSAKIWRKLKDAGLDAAVLKGQGIAQEYGELAPFRQSGDIDVWVKGGYHVVCDYVQRTAPTLDVAYHRFHFDAFSDTEVELHHRPTLMRNLMDDHKLARWYNSFGVNRFVYLDDKGFAVPPAEFNRIFILTHIYRHFLFEGVGLRQVMDYYFVLLNSAATDNEQALLRKFRLTRFAGAMMWLLNTQFRLDEDKLICKPNEKEGRFLFQEILRMGNFGRADKRYKYIHFRKIRRRMAHGRHLLLHYPSEVICTPVWLLYHKFWKWHKRKQIRKSLQS